MKAKTPSSSLIKSRLPYFSYKCRKISQSDSDSSIKPYFSYNNLKLYISALAITEMLPLYNG